MPSTMPRLANYCKRRACKCVGPLIGRAVAVLSCDVRAFSKISEHLLRRELRQTALRINDSIPQNG